MITKPTVNFSGKLGFEFNRLWDAVMRLRPQQSPGQRTQFTTQGTNVIPTAKNIGTTTTSSGKAIWL
tara:strand:+ start:300 stop:500 length:201 start_codon:yes stop_codon:yes gene_type:complete